MARSLLFVLVGLYPRVSPHAPDAMYRNEVRFYSDIRPELTIEAPSTFGRELIRTQVEHYAFKADLLRPLNRSVDQLWEDLWESQRILAAGPVTLLHGDAHIANTSLLPDGSGGLLDWQRMARGNGANDPPPQKTWSRSKPSRESARLEGSQGGSSAQPTSEGSCDTITGAFSRTSRSF